MTTIAQYQLVVNGTATNSIIPNGSVSYTSLRGTTGARATPSANTAFFGILNNKTVNAGFASGKGFDLPTEAMWEIAARAGETTKYPGGDSYINDIFRGRVWAQMGTIQMINVGTKSANNWGLYDMVGLQWDLCRDTWNPDDLAGLHSANGLVPVATGIGDSCPCRGASSGDVYSSGNYTYYRFATRTYVAKNQEPTWIGSRVAYIPD